VKIADLAPKISELEGTSSRTALMTQLAEIFKQLETPEIAPLLYMLMGRIAPVYEALEFNFSTKMIQRTLQQILGEEAVVATLMGELGDEGLVAEAVLNKKKQDGNGSIGIVEVFESLKEIAVAQGTGSQEKKSNLFAELLSKLDPLGARYIARIVMGNLRLGLSDKTILDALSFTVAGDKSWRERIERAYGARADLGYIAQLVLGTDVGKLEHALAEIKVAVGTPVASKLVEREASAATTWARMGEIEGETYGQTVVQPKLDGMRAQIHYLSSPSDVGSKPLAVQTDVPVNTGVAEVFSRNMESLTTQFPDLLSAVAQLGVQSIILDSEVVGLDLENETYLPFQDTVQRRRKTGIDEAMANIPVKAMTFDILFLNGEDLTRKPLSERIEILRKIIEAQKDRAASAIDMLETKIVKSEQELTDYFFTQVTSGLEGIIVKKLDSTYDPGTRNFDWIKLKANTQSDLVDTVDVVVLGYFYGQGARASYGFGSLLTGVYDPATDTYKSVAKVGSGFTDAQAPQMRADLEALKIDEKPANVEVEKILNPDVWVRPEIVMEVTADEITRSPSHVAAREHAASFESDTKGRGLSLRFPRLKHWNRDKQPTQTTTPQELVRLFEIRRQRILSAAG
jgi:DNA ligase 1